MILYVRGSVMMVMMMIRDCTPTKHRKRSSTQRVEINWKIWIQPIQQLSIIKILINKGSWAAYSSSSWADSTAGQKSISVCVCVLTRLAQMITASRTKQWFVMHGDLDIPPNVRFARTIPPNIHPGHVPSQCVRPAELHRPWAALIWRL